MMDYDSLLNSRLRSIKPSGIRRFFGIAEQMKDVISLGVGQPDFTTPWHIREAGIESLQRGRTWYTANSGLAELRREIAKYYKRRFDVEYDGDSEVLVTVGGSEAIDGALRAFVGPGDEVLVPEPSFVCYGPIATLCGGTVVPIETYEKDNFRLTAEALKAKITPKTKMLILSYPNNPTGAVMRREHLEEIAKLLRGTDILVLSDEIYAELTYGERHVSIASIEGMRERTIVVSGFSKAFAMTGWRIGYALAPALVIAALNKVHQYAIMCAPTVSQYAAVEAMRRGDEDVAYMRNEYNLRRRYIVDGFNRLGLHCFEPEGAFYVFPSIKSTGLSSEEFCERLVRSHAVAVVPGNAFGDCGEGFIRVCYAYSIDHITKALERIEAFLGTL